MGIGLQLAGSYSPQEYGQSGADWLEQVAAWLEGHEEEPLVACRLAVDEDDQPTLFVHLHPSAEDVELTVPDAGQLRVAAKTSSVGPGYHVFLCQLLDALGERFGITWDGPDAKHGSGDDTGYFFVRDIEQVRQEMLRWLGALAHLVTEKSFADEAQIRMVAMPLGYSFPDEDAVVGPMGPRSLAWFQQVRDDASRGVEFFPWWEIGVGAGFFLGRALCRMWQDVRWRVPVTEEEAELLMAVHLDLERAYRHDPAAAIPWREWAELLDYLGDYFGYVEFQGDDLEDEIRTRASQSFGGPRIGYRRGTVQVALTGGWSIRIPGELAEEWESDGQSWSAWLGNRTVSFASWALREGAEARPPAEILAALDWPEGETFELRRGNLVGRAVFCRYEDDGERLWNLKAYTVVDGGFALCNVFVDNPDDLTWALDVWKTLEI